MSELIQKRRIKKHIYRRSSLECTCESIKLTPKGIHKKCSARCDFCSEYLFSKALTKRSLPSISTM